MQSTNTACFTHMCGNCPCTDKNSVKIDIGTRLRTPKKGDKKDWRDFLMYLYNRNPHFKAKIEENNLIKKFNIDLKTIDKRRNKFEEYSGKRTKLYNKTHIKWENSRIVAKIEDTKLRKKNTKLLKF